ncbi:hypothetical protein [Motilimonas sp. KMU-193]|uniref:hypothetical protein n=1 Tax=Motilimonas sp. KMU-193 TaxID=3388668 RepID=UPI00396AFAA3
MTMKPALLLPVIVTLSLLISACGSGGGGEKATDGATTPPAITPTDEPIAPTEQPTPPPAMPTEQPSTDPTPVPEMQSWRLDWSAPTQRVDGSDLSEAEISGYVIKWTNTATLATGEVTVAAGETKYQLDLPSGDYQFELATKDSVGRLSQFITPE